MVTPILATAPAVVWYVARGSGIVSLLLLTASVALGIVTTMRWDSARWPRFTTAFLHRNVSLLAVVFLGVHIATVVLDGFAPIGWKDAVVPFVSPYRPFWLGLGAVAFDLVVALIVTSLLRRQIGARAWRLVHWTAYTSWPVAMVHGLGTGTDTSTTLVLGVDAVCAALVLAAIWWRLGATTTRPGVRGAVLGLSALTPIAVVFWLAVGPLASGWARRAGTPDQLLARSTTAAGAPAGPSSGTAATASPPAAGGTPLTNSYDVSFAGTLQRSSAGTQQVVVVDGIVDGGTSDRTQVVRVELQGIDSGGQFAVRSGTVGLTESNGQRLFTGTILDVQEGTLVAAPDAGSPSTLRLAIRLDVVDQATGRVTGTVRAIAGRGGDEESGGENGNDGNSGK